MVQEFEILFLDDHHNHGQFIFARQITVGKDFEVKEGSLLGGIPILNYLDMPRMLDENGQPRFDVFIFRPSEPTNIPANHFQPGQIVELITPD